MHLIIFNPTECVKHCDTTVCVLYGELIGGVGNAEARRRQAAKNHFLCLFASLHPGAVALNDPARDDA